MKRIALLLPLFLGVAAAAQSAWPSQTWASATNLTSVMSTSGVAELSGLHWNPVNKRLYAVQNDGRLRVLQYDESTSAFTSIANKSFSGGPEGITQVDFSANEFYTIDENAYEIRKYAHNASFSTLNEAKHWDLLQSPSPMEDTGNTGPEGIVFVPDSFLSAINFTSPQTGASYISTKGMGGLMFIAHQDGGYIWVFDVNPNTNNDFAYVGKFKTSREESCDLALDRSTGLLYILHNIGDNYLEVTNMTLAASPGSEPTFAATAEYFIANPSSSNVNIEGFALMPKCGDLVGSAFLCRDASSGEASSIRQDVLRWFNPFAADGNCALSVQNPTAIQISLFPNPADDQISVSIEQGLTEPFLISILDTSGRVVVAPRENLQAIDVSGLRSGFYVVSVTCKNGSFRSKFVKK